MKHLLPKCRDLLAEAADLHLDVEAVIEALRLAARSSTRALPDAQQPRAKDS